MLQIRKEQIAAFEKVMRQKFEDRTVAHIAEEFPEEHQLMLDKDGGDAKVRALVWEGVERAAGYGITSEEPTTLYIDLMMGIAPDFDVQADMDWAREVLEDPDLPEDAKMDLIYSELEDRDTSQHGTEA